MRGCVGCLVPFVLYGVPMFAVGSWCGHRIVADRVQTVRIVRVPAPVATVVKDGVISLAAPGQRSESEEVEQQQVSAPDPNWMSGGR
jgi:hypothetical protein